MVGSCPTCRVRLEMPPDPVSAVRTDNEQPGSSWGPRTATPTVAGRASQRRLRDGCAPSAGQREMDRARERADVSRPASLDRLVRPGHDRASPDEPAGFHGSSERGFMSVLVIGATGFIGPRLIRRLVARGESVVGMDLNPAAAPFARRADRRAGRPRRRHPVRGRDAHHARREAGPASSISPTGSACGEGNPHQAMRLDILGMDNCFEAARLAGVKRVVYASSIAVSGQQSHFGDRLATEDDPTPRHEPVRDAQDLQRVPGAASTSRTTACRSSACARPTSPGPTRCAARSITCRS